MQPEISEERAASMKKVFESNPDFRESIANNHALHNDKSFSPFVSVSRDPARVASSTDWTVRRDVVEKAPDIGHFRVPEGRLVVPKNKLSARESELLFEGHDLGSFLVGWAENPHRKR